MRFGFATLVLFLLLASPSSAQQVTNLSLDLSKPSPAAGARTNYAVGFTTSDTGALSAAANSRIEITLPPGASATGWNGGTVRDLGRSLDVGFCNSPDASLVSTCALNTGQSVGARTAVAVTLRGITNPPRATDASVSVATTVDKQPAASPNANVVDGGQVSKPTVTISDPSAATGARTNYVIGFKVSATGGLAATANSRIAIQLPTG